MAFKYKLSFFFSLQLIQTSVLLTTGHSLSMEVFFNLSWILGVGGGEWMDLLVMGWQRGSGWADGWGLVTWMTGLWVMGGW